MNYIMAKCLKCSLDQCFPFVLQNVLHKNTPHSFHGAALIAEWSKPLPMIARFLSPLLTLLDSNPAPASGNISIEEGFQPNNHD